jgi:hypothetical protein
MKINTRERQWQHWAHKIQDEDKQLRDTVNIGYTRYRMKINTRERQCQHWAHKIQDEDKQLRDTVNIGYTRYRMKTNNRETLSTLGTQDTG